MRLIRIIAPALLITMLSSCSDGLFNLNTDEPLNQYQVCTKLKREIIFFRNDMNHNYQWEDPTKKAALLADYQRFHCDDVLNHHNAPAFKHPPLSKGWKSAKQRNAELDHRLPINK